MFRVFWEVFRVLGGVPGFGESGSGFFGCSEMFRDVPVFLEVLHAIFTTDSRIRNKENMAKEMEDLNEKVSLKCIL